MACRPDLKKKTWVGGLLFRIYYQLFLIGMQWTAPGYIGRIWNFGRAGGHPTIRSAMEDLIY